MSERLARIAVWLGAMAAALPLPAHAHDVIPGIGAFGNGALHPLATPAQLMALLALGLLVGQHRPASTAAATAALLALMVALMVCLPMHRVAGDPDTERLLLGLAFVLGAATAAARSLPAPLLALLAAATGAAVALGSGPEGVDGQDRWLMLAGSGLASWLASSTLATLVGLARPPWLGIAVRVLGSWIAAAALLVLALAAALLRRGGA